MTDMAEKNCTTCQYYKPIYNIDPETKEVETKTKCKRVNVIMKNDNPCELYLLNEIWIRIRDIEAGISSPLNL